ncbi:MULTISPECIES: acyl-CoA dehydrogenase family protein [unclassified Microbulbifer]|uniref:acyl-CoA dehydrogenase family protein n=1 Tax=unclassified Microbulbifer TaxID=2619833 RepID=UPI001E5A23AA|nr:acyl-CoA dehydrogenase family protein [Microbulbifer sp. YPW16]UHQ55528.1 acyl-CoA dehydrogenase family protein [Microbulbifer sp. YPW16]
MILTDEHRELQRTVRNFVEREINPHVTEWEEAGEFPTRELFGKLGELGLLGISKPTEYGGLGLDFSYEAVFLEELGAAHCGGVPLAIAVQTAMATPALANFASDALREEFLLPAISGQMIGAIAVSEPGAGSDVAGVKTTAIPDGDDYLVNGSKMWITNAPRADFFCTLVNTGEGKPHRNKSLLVIPADAPGVRVGDRLKKMGMRSSETAPVFFDNVRVPQGNRIGNEGDGFLLQMLQFQEERLAGALLTIRGLENCVSSTINYTRERDVFGGPLLDNQTVHFNLAEMQTEVECLRALTWRATEAYVAGEDVTTLASMAKLKSGRLARSIPDQCLQFWGGMGYMEETPINRAYRDSRLTAIGGGADEVMLGIICKLMGILPRARKPEATGSNAGKAEATQRAH